MVDPVSGAKRGEAGRSASTARARQFVADVRPVIVELQRSGVTTCAGIALGLRQRNICKPRGGVVWTAGEIRRLLRRIEERNRAEHSSR